MINNHKLELGVLIFFALFFGDILVAYCFLIGVPLSTTDVIPLAVANIIIIIGLIGACIYD